MFANRWMNLAMLLSLLVVSSVSGGEDEKIVLVMPNATKRAFAKLDGNGDKQLTWEEFRKSTSRDQEPAAKRDFDLFDRNRDAQLTSEEYWSIPSSVNTARLRGPPVLLPIPHEWSRTPVQSSTSTRRPSNSIQPVTDEHWS